MTSVSTGVTMRLVVDGDDDVLVPTTFAYDAIAPFAVSAVFHTSEGDVVWVFGRDLLTDGLREPTGHGDVIVWPALHHGRTVLHLALSSPSGNALLEVESRDVMAFLRSTYAVVPRGTEMEAQDIDAELAELLGDGRSSHH
jgi:hypothetical protein